MKKERIVIAVLLLTAALTFTAVLMPLPYHSYAAETNSSGNAAQDIERIPNTDAATQSADHTLGTDAAAQSANYRWHDTDTGVVQNIDDYKQSALAAEVVRLHILADSDTENAQKIKLSVRDALLPEINRLTSAAANKTEAMAALQENLTELENTANEALALLSADYAASIKLSSCYFPLRIYGSQTWLSKDAILFPPGEYDTVNVVLGSGEGHNWWCLAYPSLCFIDASYDYVPKDSEEYEAVFARIEKSRLDTLFYSGFSSPQTYPQTKYADKNSNTGNEPEELVDIVLKFRLVELIKSWFGRE